MSKALVLISGGLDSTLALRLMQRLGVDVQPVNFTSPFCRCSGKTGCGSKALAISREFGLQLKSYAMGEDYLKIVEKPRFGRGKNLNPCIDCRILMFKKTRELFPQLGADFIVTGEVLGQRPMSQHRRAMTLIEKEAGLEGLVLRPLSAHLLEPTLPEKQGVVNREELLAIQGRSRKEQMDLAAEWQIENIGCPAGGCLLTDPAYSRRLKDLIESGMLSMPNCRWIQHGRYFRLSEKCKLMVARNEAECNVLRSMLKEGDILLETEEDVAGPTALMRGKDPEQVLDRAVSITAYYTRQKQSLRILKKTVNSDECEPLVPGLISKEEIQEYIVC